MSENAAPESNQPEITPEPGLETVEADVVTINQGGAQSVKAEQVTVKEGGIYTATGETIQVENGGINSASAETIHVNNGGIVAARAESIEIENGGALFVTAGEKVTLNNSSAGVVMTETVNAEGPIKTTVLLASQVNGPVETQIDTEGAAVLGLVAGATIGIILFLMALFGRRD